MTGDFNGDGRSDWMRWDSNPYGWTVCLSNGTNAFTNCSTWLGMGDGKALAGDFNGDGRSDWMRWDSSPLGWFVCLSNGVNGFTNCGNWLREWAMVTR
ncbi:VCBS repeat-containing protein [Sorangium sp. So ce291]|uniref:FG-GAP repeat domain-containing protein n=1 Tax=Sorangium sp. So ce291 TaxID=3133294 RepID=UPI003F6169ED